MEVRKDAIEQHIYNNDIIINFTDVVSTPQGPSKWKRISNVSVFIMHSIRHCRMLCKYTSLNISVLSIYDKCGVHCHCWMPARYLFVSTNLIVQL